MRPTKTYDHERVHFNLARLKKGGGNFEVAVDPDKAVAYKEGENIDVEDIIKAQDIFFDVKKGELASEERMQELFGTTNALEISKIILKEGEVQLTAEHRAEVRERKRKQLVQLIARNACDPKTKLPHPPQRIENALNEAKIHINEFQRAEDQLQEVIKALRPIIPISIESRKIHVHIPTHYAGKLHGALQQFGTIRNEKWENDGSLSVEIDVPAGMVNALFDKLNNDTHGSVETKLLD
ncbi:ribosome assembly factor SBDS [Candidatus Woesearchaeota archaeon]|nr:ribosome assembly factor SBDS [Candidatus Woesearchaeota archaeon]